MMYLPLSESYIISEKMFKSCYGDYLLAHLLVQILKQFCIPTKRYHSKIYNSFII